MHHRLLPPRAPIPITPSQKHAELPHKDTITLEKNFKFKLETFLSYMVITHHTSKIAKI